MSDVVSYERWHIPLSDGERTLSDAYGSLRAVGMRQEQVPFIVQLVENTRFDVPGVELFPGATDLKTHDYIHCVLGRGLLAMDEAFVLGFTMGSTNRVSATEEALYAFFAKHLYPRSYRFGDDEVRVFRDAIRLGFISDCVPLCDVDYEAERKKSLKNVRDRLGIEPDLLAAYYRVEKRRFPASVASQRLLH